MRDGSSPSRWRSSRRKPRRESIKDYPSKPMQVIAASAAGGISDIFMRTLGEELQRSGASR